MSESPPHIALTTEWVGTQAGGLEVYSRSLATALAAGSHGYRLTAYTTRARAMAGVSGLDARFLGARSRAVFHGIALPVELMRHPPDLLHVTSIPPLRSRVPYVMTLHDMGHRVMPDMYPPRIRWRLDRTITMGLRRARRIICVSDATRNDLFHYHPEIPADRVDVVAEGGLIETAPFDPFAEAAMRARHGLRDGYFLYVGRLHVRKNLLTLIDAYAALPEDLRAAHPLILVGRAMYGGEEIADRIAGHGIGSQVRLMGHVPDADLAALFRGALAFVYPSLFEGFGLPPLEAMSLGAPVLTSDRHSLPEVVGDAGLCVDTTTPEPLCAAMRRLANDPALRQDLSRRGLDRASRFTWARAAEQTSHIYDRVLREAAIHHPARFAPSGGQPW